MQTENTFDSAAPIGAMARLKMIRELGQNKQSLDSLGDGPMAAIKRLKLVKRSNEIRTLLGVGVIQAPASPAVIAPVDPVPVVKPENKYITTLKEIASGLYDGEGLESMFGLIQEAVTALNEAVLLDGDAENVANQAITHWAEMEERING